MKVSVRDIAKQANVSITTVSRFLNNNFDAMSEATRCRIQEVVEQSGYEYRGRKTQLDRLGLILPDISNPFFAQMASELEACAAPLGFEVLLGISGDSFEREEKLIRRFCENGTTGIVYMSTVSTPQNCYEYLKAESMPFVAMDSYLNNYTVPAAVYADGYKAMYDLTLRLIQNGHRSIAYITGLKYSSFAHNRYQGHTNALLESGISVNPDLVCASGFAAENGAESFKALCATGVEFTAVICESDMLAVGVADECRKMGLAIPEDISLTGFDDTIFARYFNPPLTSVNQHLDAQARKAIELLTAQINNEAIEEKYIAVQPTLVVRESVRDINAR